MNSSRLQPHPVESTAMEETGSTQDGGGLPVISVIHKTQQKPSKAGSFIPVELQLKVCAYVLESDPPRIVEIKTAGASKPKTVVQSELQTKRQLKEGQSEFLIRKSMARSLSLASRIVVARYIPVKLKKIFKLRIL
jgi:hypothetical protein